MVRRPWIILVTLILLFFAFAGLVTFRYLNRSHVLRDRILDELADIGGDFTIGHAGLKPGSLILDRVGYASADSSVVIHVRRVSARFTASNLMKHPGKLTSVMESLSFERPELVYYPDRVVSHDSSAGETRTSTPDLSPFNTLQRVILLDGSFALKTGTNLNWFAADNIEGWLSSVGKDSLELTMSAEVAGDSARLIKIAGDGSFAGPSFRIRIDLDDFALDVLKLPSVSPVHDLAGGFSFHGEARFDSAGWGARAHWELDDASAVIDESGGIVVDRITLTGLIDDKLVTTAGSVRFEGDPGNVTGSLSLEDSPTLFATADMPEVHIGRHLSTFADLEPELQPRGTVAGRGVLRGDLSTGRLELKATADGLRLDTTVGPFRDIHLDYSWDNARHELRFDSLATRWYGLQIAAEGRYRPSEPIPFLLTSDFQGRGDSDELPRWTEPIAAKSARGELMIRKLPDEGFVIRTEARVHDDSNPALGEFHGRYSRFGFDATLDLFSLNLPDVHLRVWQSSLQPVRLETTQPQLALAWWDAHFRPSEWAQRLQVDARARLSGDTLISVADLEDPGSDYSVRLSGTSLSDSSGAVFTQAGYRILRQNGFIGNGEFAVEYRANRLTIPEFTYMDQLSANGVLDLNSGTFEPITAELIDLDLAALIPNISSPGDSTTGGRVNGRIHLNGPLRSPDITAHLELSDGRYANLRDYWGLLNLNTSNDGELRIQQGALGRNRSTLFTIIGGYSIPGDSLNLYIESPGSDARVLAAALAGRENLMSGTARLRGQVKGQLLQPSWLAEMDLDDGEFGGVYFDKGRIKLRGQSSERLGPVVYVDTLDLSRPGHYQVTLSGAVPLKRGAGELDLSLNGNILELLPQLSSFFTDAYGQGNLQWSTTIVAGKPAAARGELSISDGSLSFADVFPQLTNLDVDVTINTEGLVDIRAARGVFDNQFPVELSNLPGADTGSTLHPIRLGLPQVDLGVLKVRSDSERGIPFRLPGIVTSEKYARLALGGRYDDWLTIAGPADSLHVAGRVTLQSATFTYPPETQSGLGIILNSILPQPGIFAAPDGDGNMKRTPAFINNAHWDVDAYIGNDVHYERIVKGLENAPVLGTLSDFLGQVVLDVDLEPTNPVFPIDISGVLADSSFRLNGTIVSTTGRIEFLDFSFDMERAEVAFDPTSIYPVISARAVTSVVQDQFTRQMYLTLYVIDPVTGERQQRGRWGDFTFVLEDELGSSQEEVLNEMGVGIQDLQGLQNRVIVSGAGGIDRAVARRWLRPLEVDAADWLGLDFVQFRPQFATNLVGTSPTDVFYQKTQDDQRTAANTSTKNLFRASRITLGKYIDRDVFISYTGQFGEEARYASVEDVQLGRLGLLQKWNLEYRLEPVSPNFVLEFGWEYENVEDRNNRSARMKYSVVFDLMRLNAGQLWKHAITGFGSDTQTSFGLTRP